MRIRWIIPLYDFPPDIAQFCLPAKLRPKLMEISALAKSGDLLAAYVTQTLGYADDPDTRIENFISAYRGRIAGLMCVLPIPTAGKVEDYHEADWDNPNNTRWPIGLPARAVRRPAPEDCPELSVVFGDRKLAVPNLNKGPVELSGVMAPISGYLLQRLPDILESRRFPAPGRRPIR